MAVRTIRRTRGAKGAERSRRDKPAVGRPRDPLVPNQDRGEALLNNVMNQRAGWVKISSLCVRCHASMVFCPQSNCIDYPTAPMCRAERGRPLARGEAGPIAQGKVGSGCEWVQAGLVYDRGDMPWIADMPGAYGPGDEFEAETGDRVFVGGKRRGEWKTVPLGGRYVVKPNGKAKRTGPAT